VVVLCGVSAVNSTIEEAAFANLTFALTTIGFVVSILLYRVRINARLAEWAMFVLAAAYIGHSFASFGSAPFLPQGAASSSDLSLATILMWMAIFRSFLLISEDRLLFTCVPTIAILGLIATSNLNNEIIVYFFMFIIASIFLLLYDNVVRAEVPGEVKKRAAEVLDLKHHLLVTMIFGIMVSLSGILAAFPLYMISSQILPYHFYLSGRGLNAPSVPTSSSQNLFQDSYIPISDGPTHLSNTVVMLVQASRPCYWRGRTFDLYTGHGWQDTTRYDIIRATNRGPDWWQREITSTTFHLPVPVLDPVKPRSAVRVEQVFRPQTGMSAQLYAAATPRTITLLANQLLVSEDTCLQTAGFQFMGPRSYKVISEVCEATPDELRNASRRYPPEILARYTAVPAGLVRVEELTWRITEGYANPYEKAKAIQSYLEENYTYNPNVPAAPEGEDVVEHFLFKRKEGFCQILATSMAIMARFAGIPSRVASGFQTGDFDTERELYLVREKHRHLWAELYFPDYGWIIFDPVPIRSVEAAEDLPSRSRFWNTVNRIIGRGIMPKFFVGLLFLISGYVGVAFLSEALSRRRRLIPPLPGDYAGQVIVLYQKMCDRLQRRGYPRPPYETSLEYREGLTAQMDGDAGARRILECITLLTELFHKARYSGQTVTQEDLDQARQIFHQMNADLRVRPKK